MDGKRYEYQFVTFEDSATQAEVEATMNDLGEKGWVVAAAVGGHLWTSFWMMREL